MCVYFKSSKYGWIGLNGLIMHSHSLNDCLVLVDGFALRGTTLPWLDCVDCVPDGSSTDGCDV